MQPQVGLRIDEAAARQRHRAAERGAAIEPVAVTSKRRRPVACAVRSASRVLATVSGAEPEALTSSPGPASGTAARGADREPLAVRDLGGASVSTLRSKRPVAVTASGVSADVASALRRDAVPRRSKVTAGAASVPRTCALPEMTPASPRLPATRSMTGSGKRRQRRRRDATAPAPSGTEPVARASSPSAVSAASSCSR